MSRWQYWLIPATITSCTGRWSISLDVPGRGVWASTATAQPSTTKNNTVWWLGMRLYRGGNARESNPVKLEVN